MNNKSLALAMILGSIGSIGSINAANLLEALEGASIKGGGVVKYGSASITDYLGSAQDFSALSGGRYQFRAWADMSTAKMDGYSVDLGVFFNSGSGNASPDGSAYGNLGGSRFFTQDTAKGDGLNVTTLKVSKDIGDTSISIGATKLNLPIFSSATDRAIGIFSTSKTPIGALNVGIIDSFGADNIAKMKIPLNGTNNNMIENNLYYIGLSNKYNGINYEIFYANTTKLANTIFANLSYTLDDIKLSSQVAYTAMRENSYLAGYGEYINNATSRGIYNLELSYSGVLGAKLGYTGSFGDGYGVFYNNKGKFNLGGTLWYNTHGNGDNGINIFGAGKEDGSSLSVLYAQLSYKISDFKIALDVAKDDIQGWRIPSKPISNDKLSFYEVAPSVSFKASKNLDAKIYYGMTFGDVKYSLAMAQANFKF